MRTVKNANGKYFPAGIEVREPDEFYLSESMRSKNFSPGYLSLVLAGVLAVIGLVTHDAGEPENPRDEPTRIVSCMDRMFGEGSVENILQRARRLKLISQTSNCSKNSFLLERT